MQTICQRKKNHSKGMLRKAQSTHTGTDRHKLTHTKQCQKPKVHSTQQEQQNGKQQTQKLGYWLTETKKTNKPAVAAAAAATPVTTKAQSGFQAKSTEQWIPSLTLYLL